MQSRNYIEIDLGALQSNCRVLQGRLAGARLMAVVKSDAYGHGMIPVARALAEEGVDCFAVAEVHEGLALRQAGVKGDIVVVLGVRTGEIEELLSHDLQPVVFEQQQLAVLSAAVRDKGRLGVHLKVDTGMGRFGIMPELVSSFVEEINKSPGLFLAGIMSHFACADDRGGEFTRNQQKIFAEIAAAAQSPHIANTAAIFNFPDTAMAMVRPGISLYGYGCGENSELTPVMSYKSEIVQVREVPAGYGLSYNHTFVTRRPSRLAILPMGYNDGYLRRMSNRAEVLIGGQRVRQRGMICMNATIVDVTDIKGADVGDEVVLLGRQGQDEITVDELAGWQDSINYEVLCLLGNLNPRNYL